MNCLFRKKKFEKSVRVRLLRIFGKLKIDDYLLKMKTTLMTSIKRTSRKVTLKSTGSSRFGDDNEALVNYKLVLFY